MELCLRKGADARKRAISLGTLDYSGDLAQHLMTFSAKMEKIFHILQDLTKRKVMEHDMYQKHFTIVDEKLTWYERAEVGWDCCSVAPASLFLPIRGYTV